MDGRLRINVAECDYNENDGFLKEQLINEKQMITVRRMKQ